MNFVNEKPITSRSVQGSITGTAAGNEVHGLQGNFSAPNCACIIRSHTAAMMPWQRRSKGECDRTCHILKPSPLQDLQKENVVAEGHPNHGFTS